MERMNAGRMNAEHLSAETRARLVDEPLGAHEKAHLDVCAECRAELDAMAEGRRALAALPLLHAPAGGWAGVEARLREEELVAIRRAWSPWLRTAASVLLFASGVATGWGVGTRSPDGNQGSSGSDGTTLPDAPPSAPAPGAGDPGAPAFASSPLREAEQLVEVTGDLYRSVLLVYRDELELSGQLTVVDPIGRYMALGTVIAATREAMRADPADPFLNGLLITTGVEREATLRGLTLVSTGIP